MILISNDENRFEVEDQYATYSPFLQGVLIATESKEAKLERFNADEVERYVSFLKGQIPRMDTKLEGILDFMGHPNVLQYPSDYWAIKLHDNWVRDNMYRLNLLEDPFYDLVEVPIKAKNYIKSLPAGIYAAGGYALYLSGYAKASTKGLDKYVEGCQYTFSDVDLFTTSKEAVGELLLSLEERVRVGDHTVDFPIQCLENKDNLLIHRPCYKGQIILRLYKAPTEIVHGFDLDCCGFLLSYDDGTPRLWATKRALWAAENGINWFDPDRMSPSYAYRMAKYMIRGFRPMLPLLHDLMEPIENKYKDRVQTIFDRIRRKFEKALIAYDMEAEHEDYGKAIPNHEVTILRVLDIFRRHKIKPTIGQFAHMLLVFDMFGASDMDFPGTQMGALMRIHSNDRKETEHLVPQDPASIVILAAMEGFYTSSWTGYDYEKDIAHDYEKVSKKMLRKLSWKVLNPMSQLSGTFRPEPIRDLKAWYLTSPLLADALTPQAEEDE